MKSWNIHSNLGTDWTSDKHIIGNTQIFADFLSNNDIFNDEIKELLYELAKQIGSAVASIREGVHR